MAELDFDRIKRNVGSMLDQGAAENEVDAYIHSEGVTAEQLRAHSNPNTAYDMADQFSRHFNRGLYSIPNAPTTIANAALGGADWVADKFGGSVDYRFQRPMEVAAPQLDTAIMDVPEAQTAAGRVMGTIGEYAGTNAIPALGTIAAAPRIAQATANATSTMGQILNQGSKAIAANPGGALAGEALSTIGAGVGGQVGSDLTDGSPMGEFIGATIGGIGAPGLAAIAPTNLARRASTAVVRRLSPKVIAERQRQQVANSIANDLTPEGQAAIQRTAEIQELVPEYQPSLAEATESPSFVASQRELEANFSGPDLDQAARRYGQNDAVIQNAANQLGPKSYMDPQGVFSQQRTRIDGDLDRLSLDMARARQGERYVADGLIPGDTRRGFGGNIRDEIINAKSASSERMASLANSMGLNDPAARFAFGPIRARLEQAAKPRSQLSDPNARPTRLLNDIKSMDNNASIVDLMELRTRIDTDIREAQRLPTGEKRLPNLQAMKRELDAVVDNVIRNTGNEQLADNLAKFRNIYREEHVELFSQGGVGRTLQKDGSGTYRIPDEQVAAEFFDGWNQTAAEQFNQVFPNGSGAHTAMEAVSLDRLYNHAVRDGVLNPNLIESWKRQNAGVLQSFPQISQRVNDVEQSVLALSQRRAELLNRTKQVEQSYLSRELARIENPTSATTPEAVIDAAIKNPAQMRRLMQSVKAPEARNAIARYVWDTALSQNDPLDYLRRNGMSLHPALGDRYQTALLLAEAVSKNRLVPRPVGREINTNPLGDIEDLTGVTSTTVANRLLQVRGGFIGARYGVLDIASRIARAFTGNAARKALQEALYDPKIAAELASALQSGSVGPEGAKRLYTFLLSNGLIAGQNQIDLGRQQGGNVYSLPETPNSYSPPSETRQSRTVQDHMVEVLSGPRGIIQAPTALQLALTGS